MRNAHPPRTFSLSLLPLVAVFLIFINSLSTAQNASSQLEGTSWQMEPMFKAYTADSDIIGAQEVRVSFEFHSQGRVSFIVVTSFTTLPKTSVLPSNSAGGGTVRAITPPPLTTGPTSEMEIGRYTLTGNLIQMEFAKFVVNGKIDGNLIEGSEYEQGHTQSISLFGKKAFGCRWTKK